MKAHILAAYVLLAGCAYQPPQPAVPITVGMDTSTLTTYYGRPVRINRAAYGDQWVFRQTCIVGPILQDNLYVYVRNGEVVSWQQYACH